MDSKKTYTPSKKNKKNEKSVNIALSVRYIYITVHIYIYGPVDNSENATNDCISELDNTTFFFDHTFFPSSETLATTGLAYFTMVKYGDQIGYLQNMASRF